MVKNIRKEKSSHYNQQKKVVLTTPIHKRHFGYYQTNLLKALDDDADVCEMMGIVEKLSDDEIKDVITYKISKYCIKERFDEDKKDEMIHVELTRLMRLKKYSQL